MIINMCTFNIAIEDQLVTQAKSTLPGGVSFHLWLQQKVVELLKAQVNNPCRRTGIQRHRLTDEQLAEQLAQYAPLSENDFPDLSTKDYAYYMRSMSGRVSKGIEKWL